MSIKKVEIENFTVFEKVFIDFGEGVNVFIGENGIGKTHLLKLLYSFCNCNYDTEKSSIKDIVFLLLDCFDSTNLGLFYKPQNTMRLTFHTTEYPQGVNFPIYQVEGDYPPGHTASYKINTVPSIFIPAKDMLTHSKGLIEMAKKYSKDMPFDKTLLDIIEKARQWKLDEIPVIAQNIIPALENIIDGIIILENDAFYVQKRSGKKVEFAVEAEGIKKIGLLWQLLMNENITKDTVLLWDEPEANINPKIIPDIVEILLELSRHGVQVFVATHDYIFAKYFEVKRKENDFVSFHSLYKTSDGVKCESNGNFRDLKNNSIVTAFDELMDEVIERNLGE